MRTFFLTIVLFLFWGFLPAGEGLSPYYKIAETDAPVDKVIPQVKDALRTGGFEILGSYHPGNKTHLAVITFTRNDLKNTVVKVKDRGALAAVLKVGLVRKGGKTVVSCTNPGYLFRAYLRQEYSRYAKSLNDVENDLKTALTQIGNLWIPFGGTVAADELPKYHYKIMMPYFTDPVELGKFSSFDEGLRIISDNLKNGKSHTVQVYRLVYPGKDVAVFGIGLLDASNGEAHFLPKIGEEHVAAMPYEIILQGNRATMLHGRYRLALHWPGLSMGTFMTIVSTPGDIEDDLKSLCK